MQKQSGSKLIIIVITIFVAIIIFGVGLGILYSSLPEHNPEKNQQYCEKDGGQWTEEQTCLLSHKKAGEECTDGGQCISGICFPPMLTDEQKNSLRNAPLENIVGTCYPDDVAVSCIEQVLKGRVSEESMCLSE